MKFERVAITFQYLTADSVWRQCPGLRRLDATSRCGPLGTAGGLQIARWELLWYGHEKFRCKSDFIFLIHILFCNYNFPFNTFVSGLYRVKRLSMSLIPTFSNPSRNWRKNNRSPSKNIRKLSRNNRRYQRNGNLETFNSPIFLSVLKNFSFFFPTFPEKWFTNISRCKHTAGNFRKFVPYHWDRF